MSGYEGHVAKRQKTDDGRYNEDPHKPKPSPVVHVRNLSEHAMESDLVEAVQGFGTVKDVILMPRRKQGLIEFEDISGAKQCVEYAEMNPIFVASQTSFFNFSTSQKIQRPGEGEDARPPNHVVLFTILNPQYPISVDVMHTICSPYGQVQRIVIFKKNGVQAMVEYDNLESAKRAKQALNGADIYSGCCTLKIEFAKPTRLNVVKNDNESWDYTNPSLGKDPHSQQQRGQPLLQEPRFGNGPADMRGGPPGGFGGPGGGFGGGYYDEFDSFGGGRGGPFNGPPDRFGGPRGQYDPQGMGPQSGGQGCVVMVYGLNMQKINCEKLFNLFCLYGNVVRIKFLKSKEGAAMVQLGDGISVDRAIQNLHNCYFFGGEVQLSPSKQAFLQDVLNPHELPDGTPSFKDFMGNRNNRFTNPEAAAKNRIQSPAKILHFFNAPPAITEDELGEIFESCYGKRPIRVKQFPSKTERSSTGLLEFESKSEAIEALIMTNHHPIPGAKSPFVFKLCFSAAPTL
ncbi:heterogeneous nuclear ribonucleoprotein L-like isoform X1 [Babylonia areolata]|uniref:heterogeneous nuclear ribonucleoprotein L-like isoform X1 n=1 Tax=Babylonia areolata TaxID=304850 RepID=UPI003FD6ABE9